MLFQRIFGRSSPDTSFVPRKYVIFNVETFNTWFNDGENNAVYANPGIFLRLDKLSISHIKDYLTKCHNLNLGEWDLHEDIEDFHQKIREDWRKRIQDGSKNPYV